MIIRVASPKVASPSNDFLRFELQWITLKPSPGLGLELSLLDLAPWSLRCLSAQSDGCIDDSKRSCHPMSFLVLSSAHPYGTLFSNVSQRVLKAETAGSNCFCWFLATYLVAICSKKCDFSIYSFEKWQKTKDWLLLRWSWAYSDISAWYTSDWMQQRGAFDQVSWTHWKWFVWLRSATQHPCQSLFDGWVVRKCHPAQFRIWITHSS
jgi:hypothetical protein